MTNPTDPIRDDEDVAPSAGPTDVAPDTSGHAMGDRGAERRHMRDHARDAGHWVRSTTFRRGPQAALDLKSR